MKKFGTFGGVFTPSILTILGVIMYLRMGWVIGNAGTLAITLGIILIAHIVSISTGLSISSIATDKKIKSGGVYFILSRSLGFPIGGAIGLTLYLATALSISLYLIGFAESLLVVMQDWLNIEEVSTNHLRIVGTVALLVIVIIAYISTSFAIKTQYIILGTIALSLISIFLGTSEGKGFDFSHADLANAPSFAIIFGVFFPAVTGFTAGVAMSGDLKDPTKSIPWGTMLAIFVGLIIYTGLSVFIFYKIPGAELQQNNNALVEFSWIPQLVIAGIWGATLSSALGGILGGPRILQSMSIDKITPKIFGKGVGAGNEPRNALILTFALAEMGILIGELNVIAGIVAMFYMAAYMVINLSCFLEKWASPDFRPKFKINILIPLIGTITIFLLMIQLNLIATLLSVIIMGLIFIMLTRKQLELSSGNVWSSVWSSVVKLGLKNLDQKPKNKRHWEPNILLFSGGTEARPHLLRFSKAISGKGGMVSNFDLIENPLAKTLFPKHEQAQTNDDLKNDTIFHRKQECKNLFVGIEAIASTYGFSGIEPNTILMGWARNTKDPIWFAKLNQKLNDLDYNTLYLDYDKTKGFGSFSKIDIWWNNNSNVGDLTLQIAKRVLLSSDWNNAEIRIMYLNNNHKKNVIENLIRKQLASLRIDFPFQVLNNEIEKKSFYEVIQKHSYDTDLILLEIPTMKKGAEASFVQQTNDFLGQMGTTLLVRASESFSTKSKDRLELENIYHQQHSTLEVKSKTVATLQLTGNSKLDEEVQGIDIKINEINNTTSKAIFTAISDVYSSFFTLLKGKLEEDTQMSAISFLEIKQNLVEDIISNKRFSEVSEIIKESIKQHLDSVKKVIDSAPKIIDRSYTADELISNENDSKEVGKAKEKFRKKRREKLHFLKTVESFFENEYMENLAEQLLFIGVYGAAINSCFINWTGRFSTSNTIDLKAFGKDLEGTYEKLSTHYLTNLNGTSRQMCNSILLASNSINEDGIALLAERKIKRKNRKASSTFINTYSNTWIYNHQALTNQMLLHVQLNVLKIKTTKSIKSTTQSIDKTLFSNTLKIIEKCQAKLDSITVEEINKYENELFHISNQVNADTLLKTIQAGIVLDVVQIQDSIDVLSHDELTNFESKQTEIAPKALNARKITKGLIENEIISNVYDLYQQSINEARTENTKLENALELLKFTLINTSDKKGILDEILKKTHTQFTEATEKIKILQLRQDSEIKELFATLNSLLKAETVSKRADDYDVAFQKKLGSKRLSLFIKNKTEIYVNRLDNFILKTRDKLAKSDSQYRAKPLQNQHSKFADFSDKVSLTKTLAKQLPFYYNQLFTGKHSAPKVPLKNRLTELLEVEKAVNRFNEGKSGAILFTGDHLSGKTYLMQNAVNVYLPKNVIRVSAPLSGALSGTEILDNALAVATGYEGDSISIMKQIKKKSTIVFEDLELWWTRCNSGSVNLNQIVDLIKLFGSKHIFVLDCNTIFFQHIRQYIKIEDHLLATINTTPLSISEIKESILSRHRTGGMSFVWQSKTENKLSTQQINKLFSKITSYTEGNIGMAFYMWLGNITHINKTELHFDNFEKLQLPAILNAEWENMLVLILMHKQITVRRLKQVYHTDSEANVMANLQSLIRAGLVLKTASGNYTISPFLISYLTKYLQNKI